MAQIIDSDPASNEFFYITDLPAQFGGGKNSFIVNTTPKIAAGTSISVVVTDPLGNVLPTKIARPVNSKFGGDTDFGVFYSTDVSDSVKNGFGNITITSPTVDGNSVIWSRNILIDTTQKTTSKVVFFGSPYIDVTPEIYTIPSYPNNPYVLSSGSFNSTAVFPRHNYNGDFESQFNSTIYQVNLQSGTPFSSSMEGEKIRLKNIEVQIFTYTNNSIGSLSYSGPLDTDFISTILRVINKSSLLLSIPFSTVADLVTLSNKDSEYSKNNLVNIEGCEPSADPTKQVSYFKKNFYALSLSKGDFEIIHKNIPISLSASAKKCSVLNLEFRDIRVLGGALDTYRVYCKSLNTPNTKVLLHSGKVEVQECIVSTNFNNGYYNLPGNFFSQAYLNQFWLTSGAITFSQDNSVLIDGARISHASNTSRSDYVLFKDNVSEVSRDSTYISPNLMDQSYWYGKSQAFNNVLAYPNTSFYEAASIPQLNPFTASQENLLGGPFHNSNPIKLVGNCLYNFSMRIRATNTNTEASLLYIYFINGSDVVLVGTIDSTYKFGANELYFNSFFSSNTKYGTIKLIPVSGEWHISNLSIKPYQSVSFSPDHFSVKVPIKPTVANELFEIEVELYDGSDRLCYGAGSYTFAYNLSKTPLKKQIYVDVDGVTIS